MYTISVKKRELENKLRSLGWRFEYPGKKHDQWTNGVIGESVPRHKEINEILAQKILKTARENPPSKV